MSSVLSQRSDRLQYIVIDGMSADESIFVLEQYRNQLDGLIVEPDEGHAHAINKGFALCDGEIMGWINSDDILLDGALETVLRVFDERPDIEWITGRASSMDENGVLLAVEQARPWSRLRFLSGDHQWIQQESTFWRRSLWERTGATLDVGLDLANDFDLWARFFRKAELHTVDRHLGCFRVREGQRSVTQIDKYRREVDQVLRRELDALDPRLRTGLGRMIPDRPRTLSARERNALEPRMRLQDPAIINPSRPAANLAEAASQGWVKGDALRLYAKSDLARFKNRHKGERCFIMGNGPSLRETDLSKLKDETVFACNLVYLLFDQINWRPTYYSCVDSRMLLQRHSEIRKMLEAEPGIHAFFPTRLEEHAGERRRMPVRALFAEADNRSYFEERYPTSDNLPFSMFSLDADDWVAQPHTVSVTLLQLAAYMGFSQIYLIGCDTHYTLPPSVRVKNGDPTKPGLELLSTSDDDHNHFDYAYFGSGKTWHAPNIPAILKQYAAARDALRYKGVEVYNATVGGKLDIFTRVKYESLFSEKVEPRDSTSSFRSDFVHRRPPKRSALGAGRAGTVWAIAKRNSLLFAGLGAGAMAAIVGASLAPSLLWSAVVFSMVGLLVSLALSLAVTFKIRRIILIQNERVRRLELSIAKTEVALVEIEEKQS